MIHTNTILSSIFAFMLSALLFIGCSPGSGVGTLEVRMHDAPGDFEEVNISIDRVEVNRSESDEGWVVLSEPGETYNLLELVNGIHGVLGEAELETGTYQQIRLILASEGNNVVVGGQTHNLTIPSGSQTGLKVNINAEIEDDKLYVLLLDFDVHHSIVVTGQNTYLLKPVIRASALADTGTISGQVDEGARAAIFAILTDGAEPDTVATTYADLETGGFKLVGLEENTYTVAIDPRESETFASKSIDEVVVTRNSDTDLGQIELEAVEPDTGD